LAKTPGKTTRCIRGQHAEERSSRRYPRQRPLQHPDEQAALTKLAHDEGGERPVHDEVGTEQNTVDAKAGVEKVATGSRRNVEHRDRVADERQGGPNVLQALLAEVDRQVAGLPPRRCPQRGQVHRKPLLQLARPARGDQGRARRPATGVDQEARPVGLRAGTGERGGGRARAASFPHGGDEDNAAAHRSLGIA